MGVTNNLLSGMILLAEAHSTQVWLVTGSRRPGLLRWKNLQLKNPLLQTCNSFWNVWLPQIFLPTKKQKQKQKQKTGCLGRNQVFYIWFMFKRNACFFGKKTFPTFYYIFTLFKKVFVFFLGCPKMVENVGISLGVSNPWGSEEVKKKIESFKQVHRRCRLQRDVGGVFFFVGFLRVPGCSRGGVTGEP